MTRRAVMHQSCAVVIESEDESLQATEYGHYGQHVVCEASCGFVSHLFDLFVQRTRKLQGCILFSVNIHEFVYAHAFASG